VSELNELLYMYTPIVYGLRLKSNTLNEYGKLL